MSRVSRRLAAAAAPLDGDDRLVPAAGSAGEAREVNEPLPERNERLPEGDAATPPRGFRTAGSGAEGLPEGDEKVRTVRAMFDAIAPRYDLVNRIMTFGMDVGWRRGTVRSLGLAPGAVVADLACGTGDLCRELAAAGHRPVGIDLSLGMLAAARTTAPLVQGDALRLPVPGSSLDGVTCGFALRNLAELPPFFAELARALRPGGRVALLEVATPRRRLLRAGHRVYFGKLVPLLGGALSDGAAYRYLPRSVAYLPDAPRLLAMLGDAGFVDVERRLLSAGIAQLVTATRAPSP